MTDDEVGWSTRRSEEVAQLVAELSAADPGSPEHQALRDRLVEVHLPLVRYLARRFAGSSGSFEDLVQVGSVGLIKAVDRFEPALGHEFAAYAAPTVIGEIKRYQRDVGWLVRAPRRAHELQGAVAQAREDLSQELGRVPTLSEIAHRVGATAEEVVETVDLVRGRAGEPLDRLLDSEGAGSWQRLLAVEDAGFESAEQRTDLRVAMAALSEQERRIVILRFRHGMIQTEIAEVLGVSQMQVSRLLRRSLSRMRGILEQQGEHPEAT